MSIVSQIAIVLLIVLTIVIIAYANKGLRYAEEEGEHFVDEWALKQTKMEEQKRRIARENSSRKKENTSGKIHQEERINRGEPKREPSQTYRVNKVVPIYPAKGSRYRLTVKDEQKKVIHLVDVDHYPYTIGRDKSNDLVLDDIYVARKHCIILEEDGQVILKNRGSQNAIFAGGKQVERYPLKKEGHFYIGTYEFIVSETGHRSQPTMVAPVREKVM